jgi:hypothetical protein
LTDVEDRALAVRRKKTLGREDPRNPGALLSGWYAARRSVERYGKFIAVAGVTQCV